MPATDDDREAIEYYNAHVEKHGLPLDEFQRF
ncbi:type II toxin-antitoxin system CcdA family antitoxin [Paraburkholderia bryophila]|nr:type II toxin-antitoxin system CcdA family antitoxin [Paraburkholderia bryophila]WCM23669.1 type II toxin-antitoxin system CcdA family antitoxin [Paraburkholderia bryophila]